MAVQGKQAPSLKKFVVAVDEVEGVFNVSRLGEISLGYACDTWRACFAREWTSLYCEAGSTICPRHSEGRHPLWSGCPERQDS